ncbi:MAG: hypothetical protein H0T79_21675, partial [Deltaproteobacteria bacterium]|nr:hypothetical protein [Deltaproteobacteria bacterium]
MSVELPKATLRAGIGLPSSSKPGEASGFVVPLHPLYSSGQVGAAAFVGGPLGAAGLLALNYRHLRTK